MLEEKYKYSTHVLELVRNNGKSSEKENMDRGFLMFDYFDILIHKELRGEEKVYSNYFSIEDTFEDDRDYKVSFKTLSLYCDADCDENPFTLGKTPPEDEAETTLSATPFLGLIQISLCRENYEWELVRLYKDVDEFLKRCEDRIMETVSSLDCFDDQGLTAMQLYRSSTTGDFCLAIRTDSVKKIYKAALALNDSQNVPDDFPKVLTYTNVGMECKMGPDKSYSTLAPEFIESHGDINFAVRFSADKGVLPLLTELDPDGKKYKAIKGLFGRYDYLLHINLKDFADVYPLLCEKKFGVLRKAEISDGKHITILEKILQYSNVENVNERILVDLDLPNGIQQDSEKDVKSHQFKKGSWVEAVTTRNKELYDRIQGLDRWKQYFSEENRSFRDLHRCMIGIYKTFSAIGMEKEAYLNWLMFGQDMEMLCECLELCLQKYSKINEDSSMDEQQRRIYRLRLLKDWRINIQAINQYTRLVQNINYQTYQSPIYEIQTQIDTEKTMIAYRQAMRSYMDSYITSGIIDMKDTAQIVPIIFPDLSKDRVEVTAPFISQKKGDIYLKRAIMCTVPSFEYFGRLYDLLPWLLHESSHHLRVIDRKKRNEFLIKYLFSHIYTIVLENSLSYLANDNLYWTAGRVEKHLIDCMVQVTVDEFCSMVSYEEENKCSFQNFSFEKLGIEIEQYLEKLFFGNKNDEIQNFNIKEIRERAFEFYLSEYRKTGLLNEDKWEIIVRIKKKCDESGEEKLAAELLKYYFENLWMDENDGLKKEGGICLKDLMGERGWFERKLLEVDNCLIKDGVSEAAVKEYHFKIIEIYKIVNAYARTDQEEEFGDDKIEAYLKQVFKRYQKLNKKNNWEEMEKFLRNPSTAHVLRSLGLLDMEESTFCSKMKEVLRNIDYNKINAHKELRLVIYREVFADLLMVTSLGINSFGYCRQVLQTISDARTKEGEYWYSDANIQRFRIVAAVLLEEELESDSKRDKLLEDKEINRAKLEGSSIIEKGNTYCTYTLECICGKLLEAKDVEGDGDRETLILQFLEDVRSQLELFVTMKGRNETYYSTYLYILLHGKGTARREAVKKWEECGYDNLVEACQTVKYIFWRLEIFCLGIKNILQDTNLIVPLDIFQHMKEIRKIIRKEDGSGGCCWENEWECLAKTKLDVGEFYNDPKLVYEKKSPQKLENTIDFIQNYYYYNRFEMTKE